MAKSSTSYRNVRKSHFTQISNDLLNDTTLTLESKALLSIFLSNSDDWELHMSEIIKRSKNGRDAHYTALKKLIKAGYIARLEYKNNSSKQFINLEYIFSDNKDDIIEVIQEAQRIASEQDNFIILTYKDIENEQIETSIENDEEKPFPENPYTGNPYSEKPYTENQYNNNTNSNNKKNNNTKSNNNNGMNGMSGNNIDSADNENNHTNHTSHEIELQDEQSHLLKPMPKKLQEFIKSRYTLEDSISIINKIFLAKKAAGESRNDVPFFYFEQNEDLANIIIDILITVNREMKKKGEPVQSLLGYYYNSLVNGLEDFHFTSKARENSKKNIFNIDNGLEV